MQPIKIIAYFRLLRFAVSFRHIVQIDIWYVADDGLRKIVCIVSLMFRPIPGTSLVSHISSLLQIAIQSAYPRLQPSTFGLLVIFS